MVEYKIRILVYMLTVLNLLNWVDRGLIAGAGTLIKGCVIDIDHCGHLPKIRDRCKDDPDDSHKQVDTCSSRCRVCGDLCENSGELVEQTGFGVNDFVLGFIQSSFMIGYMSGSFIFSRSAHDAKVYRILAYGMIVWTLSAVISGCSGFLSNYSWSRYVLTTGRILSGVGEAALATVAVPHLDDILPEAAKGKYLAIYFSAIPVGNALGFVFAGVVSEYLTWKWTFLIEAMIMPPFIIAFIFHPDLQSYTIARSKRHSRNRPTSDSPNVFTDDANAGQGEFRALDDDDNGAEMAQSMVQSPLVHRHSADVLTLWNEIVMCLKSRTFIFASFGLAMFTFTAAGLGFYMPMFLQSYRPCDKSWKFTETQADEAFGVMVLTSGFCGVLLGGIILDIAPTSNPVAHSMKLCVAELAAATFFLGLGMFIVNVKLFFACAWISTFLAFATTAPINRVLLGSVPIEARSIAMALSVVIGHLFGDVPSPILIGAISDAQSPKFALFTAWIGFAIGTGFWIVGLFTSLKYPTFQDVSSPLLQ